METVLLIDDPTDTDIPNPDEFTARFTDFFNSRAVCVENLFELFVTDLGLPDGGTVIDGGRIKTGLIEGNGPDASAFWDLNTGHFRTEANVGTASEFILDSTADGYYNGTPPPPAFSLPPNSNPNIRGGLIVGSTITGSEITSQDVIETNVLYTDRVFLRADRYLNNTGLLFHMTTSGVVYGQNYAPNTHRNDRICSDAAIIYVTVGCDMSATSSGDKYSYLEFSSNDGASWSNLSSAILSVDADPGSEDLAASVFMHAQLKGSDCPDGGSLRFRVTGYASAIRISVFLHNA